MQGARPNIGALLTMPKDFAEAKTPMNTKRKLENALKPNLEIPKSFRQLLQLRLQFLDLALKERIEWQRA